MFVLPPSFFLGEIQDGGTRYQAADQREGRLEESPKTWHRTPRRPCPLKSSQKYNFRRRGCFPAPI